MAQVNLKQTVTLGELIGFSVVVVAAISSFWISTNVRLTALEIRQSNQQQVQEVNNQKFDESFKVLNTKLDELNKGQTTILVNMQNKQDRKQ